tara:strand:+ start:8528 stop:9730 length:1203 start_codon:yes stop_codon:yes gene_type:complete
MERAPHFTVSAGPSGIPSYLYVQNARGNEPLQGLLPQDVADLYWSLKSIKVNYKIQVGRYVFERSYEVSSPLWPHYRVMGQPVLRKDRTLGPDKTICYFELALWDLAMNNPEENVYCLGMTLEHYDRRQRFMFSLSPHEELSLRDSYAFKFGKHTLNAYLSTEKENWFAKIHHISLEPTFYEYEPKPETTQDIINQNPNSLEYLDLANTENNYDEDFKNLYKFYFRYYLGTGDIAPKFTDYIRRPWASILANHKAHQILKRNPRLIYCEIPEYLDLANIGKIKKSIQAAPRLKKLIKRLAKRLKKEKNLSPNPFKGKTPKQINRILQEKGFSLKGKNPAAGIGSYFHPKTGRKYYIDLGTNKYKKGKELPHIDIHRMYKNKVLEKSKKKLPLGDRLYEKK